ncbi:MAG: uncharacterized protein QOF83_4278 [Solirubrobacteraceae bacterium]|nr:uncharacterized protein [Solirubrobacteraceae bacterium]
MAVADLDARFAGLPTTEYAGGLTVIEAESHKSRRRGLSKLDGLPVTHALHIPQTPSVHTFGMRFALDLIWLDKRGAAVRIDHDVSARRMRFCARARSVIETVAGQADSFLAAGVGAPETAGAN